MFLEYTIRQQLDEEAKMHKREENRLRGEARDFQKRIKEAKQALRKFISQQNDQMFSFSLIKQD